MTLRLAVLALPLCLSAAPSPAQTAPPPVPSVAELAKLQDRVPPFPSDQVVATLQRVYAKPGGAAFASFRA
mgnify:CR=1 FL=1